MGKGKVISTAADVLENLAEEFPIARKVLNFRQTAKLKGTYVDALPALIEAKTGRLHTTFNQAGAATGRLSSSDPNLQNIPIRTVVGRRDRAAFVPRPGWKLVVADYSQIELRLLAHFSRDPVLLDAFRNGEDIHTRTAAEVFGVPPLMITSNAPQRRAGNFGIVYGQNAVRAGANRWASGARKLSCTFRPTLSATRGAEIHRRHHRQGPARWVRHQYVRAAQADSGYEQPQSERARNFAGRRH